MMTTTTTTTTKPGVGSVVIRAAALQMNSGCAPDANLAVAAALIEEAARAGATLVALPENFALMPADEESRRRTAEVQGSGVIQQFLADQARRHQLWLVGGTMPMRSDSARPRATCLIFGPDGSRQARYDKIHLFDADLSSGGYRESNRFEAGDTLVTCPGPAAVLGLAVCYDLRFPEHFRALAAAGAQIMVVPSAFTEETGRAHWELLVRARAVDTLSFVVAPAQGGFHENGRATYGNTMIVGPWGDILGRQPQGPGCVVADLDCGQLEAIRRRLPALSPWSVHADPDI